jgi:hypothetical protein
MEVSGQLRAPATLHLVKVSATHWIGGWVEPKDGLDTETKTKCPFIENGYYYSR